MKYENATWRIRIAKGQYVELSVKGNENDRCASEPRDVVHAAMILKEVGRALDRISSRWNQIENAEEKL